MKYLIFISGFLVMPLTSLGFVGSLTGNPLLSEKPVFFAADGFGGFYGETERGTVFTQRVIANEFAVRLHKFTIAELSFYVSERGIIEAASDTEALSIYFARV